jgi:hypothetical protein
MQKWLNYFEWNRANRPPVAWDNGINISPHLCTPLIRSLQKFQIGESGEGRRLRRHAAATGDRVYAAAIDLFIKEEQTHAALMGKVITQLGAPLLKSEWSHNCFWIMRHLFGLHQELMVLLLPEMIAKCYFRALHDGTRDPVLRAVFGQIARDEEGHLAFHVDYLRDAFQNMSFRSRILVQVGWRFMYRMTCLVVMFDHRSLLRAVGMRRQKFWDDCGRVFDEVAAGVFSPAQVLAPFPILQNVRA